MVTLVVFHCPESTYWERNQKRRHRIHENVLAKQLQSMEFPELDESDRTLVVDETGNTLASYGYC